MNDEEVPVMTEWEIERSAGKCCKCEHQFQEEEHYFSALYDKGAKFERKDYCLSCWSNNRTNDVFSFWRTRVPKKDDEREQKLVDDEVIMNFFKRLEGETDETKKNFRYVLALLLIRKKKLKLIEVKRENDEEFLLLENPQEEAQIRVPVRNLSDEEIRGLTQEVGQILRVKV